MPVLNNINVYTVPQPINLIYGPAKGVKTLGGTSYNIFGGGTIQANQLIQSGVSYRICQGSYSTNNPGTIMRCQAIKNTSSSTTVSGVSGSTLSSLEFNFS